MGNQKHNKYINHISDLKMIQSRTTLLLTFIACALVAATSAFTTAPSSLAATATGPVTTSTSHSMAFDDFGQETAADTKERIQGLVDEHSVLLFMKGSKLFPQCGFSNTATQILGSYDIDFHTVDVLSDESIRSGVKDFSQWPTIPQLYVCGEFIGGSDIMIEMYQNGELGEMIEKAKADMV